MEQQTETPPTPVDQDQNPNLKTLDVLLVEDNAFTAMTVQKTLESLGMKRVRVANNGFEALELLDSSESPADLILLDLRMPSMGGLELISRLKDRQYSGHIIITSGVTEETMNSVRQVTAKSGIHILGFLPKPVTAAALKDLLDSAI
jgi:CheY-like chemotaxis protein